MAGIYLHIPFCKQACVYCNFHFSTSLKLKADVLQAMLQELKTQSNYLEGEEIDTIYFGGGTPSLLTADEISVLIDAIYENYNVQQLKECTLEANPDDLSTNYLKALSKTSIDRLSIGIQSFRQQDLLFMHRAHNAQQAEYAIKAAQDVGFTNLSIDLIYGIPGLTDEYWKQNIAKVKEYGIPHFSAYSLTVEHKTALHHAIQTKKTKPLDAEQSARQFEVLMQQAEIMGYDHYEISNLALPGKYAIHNTNYWLGTHYLGIGPAAHSFNGNSRKWNIANNAQYATMLLQNNQLIDEVEVLQPKDQLNEYIMTSLRTMWGIDLEKISLTWDADYTKQIEKTAANFIEKKWLLVEGRKLILTKTGKLFADKIASELFVERN